MGIFKKAKDKVAATTKEIPGLAGIPDLEIPMPKVQLSVRLSIVTLVTALIVFTSSAIMLTYYLGARKSAKFLVDNLMGNMVERMVDKSLDYLGTASVVSELSEKLTRNRVLAARNQAVLVKYFKEIMSVNESFSNVFYGTKSGKFTMVKRHADNSFSERYTQPKGKKIVTTWRHKRSKWKKKFRNKKQSVAKGYDPRKRSWYKKAAKAKKLIWTDVYIFDSDKKPGITCAIPVYKGRSLQGVIGIDIGLVELSYFLGGTNVSGSGKAFIFTEKNELIAVPATRDQSLANLVEEYEVKKQKRYRLATLDKSPFGEIRSSYSAIEKLKAKEAKKKIRKKLRKIFKRKQKKIANKHFRFKHEGDEYVGMYAAFPRSSTWAWNIGIIVPEGAFLDTVQRTNVITMIIAVVLVGSAVFIGWFFAGRLSDPLSSLAVEMEKISRFDLTSKKDITSGIKEVQDMIITFVKMKYGLRSFRKFVPADLVRELLEMEQEAELGGDRRSLTVHFSDIKGFTSISEKISPEDLVELLGEYLGEMSRIIAEHDGTLDKYIGDAVMAFWGAPRPLENHAEMACRAALACQRRLDELAIEWEKRGKPIFKARIGLNSGDMIVGNIGSIERLNYTVMGDTVNLASRLEAVNNNYGTWIMLGQNTYEMVKDKFETRHLDWVAVKGKEEAVAIYELVSEAGQVDERQKKFQDLYEAGMQLYKNRQWDEALQNFNEALEIRPDEVASVNMVARIEEYKNNPPPEGWQGELVLTSK